MRRPPSVIPRLAAVLVAAAVAAACGGDASPSPIPDPSAAPPSGTALLPLEGTRWVLPPGAVPALEAGAAVDAVFDAGSLAGRGPCNAYGGRYALAGARLVISDLFSTKKSCGGQLDTAEQAFFAALKAVASHEIGADALVLRDAAGALLIAFRADLAGGRGSPAALPGTAWTVTGYAGATGVATGVIPGTTITLEFGVNGSAGGTAGCNSYGGEIRADPETGRLAFGPLISTEMACDPPPTMAQESAYLATLARTAAYQIVEGRLVLLDAGGAVLVEAEPARPVS
jgi:heat shock protein HslJ